MKAIIYGGYRCTPHEQHDTDIIELQADMSSMLTVVGTDMIGERNEEAYRYAIIIRGEHHDIKMILRCDISERHGICPNRQNQEQEASCKMRVDVDYLPRQHVIWCGGGLSIYLFHCERS